MNLGKNHLNSGISNKQDYIQKRKQDILKHTEQVKHYKRRTINFVKELENKLENDEISYAEFNFKLKKALLNKDLDAWINYYDKLIEKNKVEFLRLDELLKQNEQTKSYNISLLFVLSLVLVSLAMLIYFKPQLTSLAVYEQGQVINESLTINLLENIIVNESIVKVILNEQQKELSLTEFLILENLITIDLSKFNLIAEEGSLVVQVIFNNSVVEETSLLIEFQKLEELTPIENITAPVEKIVAPINDSLEHLERLKKKFDSDKINIKEVEVIEEKYRVKIEFNKNKGLFVNAQQEKGSIEINGLVNIDELQEIKVDKLSDNKVKNGKINTEVIAINKVVISNAVINIPKDGGVNKIVKCDDFDFNSFTCNNWIKTNIPFTENGTSIIFTVNEISVYAGAFIEITKAQHLDENREVMEDIYNDVKALDDNWSKIIPENNYVRVVFEQKLSSKNDITIYPKIISGNPKIKVFEVDSNNVIAEFISIENNQYNKVILNDLESIQDTFDLLILDGSLQFDHIVDPLIVSTSRRYNITSFPPQPNVWTVFNGTGNSPNGLTGSNHTNSQCGQPNNLRASDNVRCVMTERGGNFEPWIRFNFTIAENPSDITSIRITLEGVSGSTDAVKFLHYNQTGGVWSAFGATTTTTEVTRQVTYKIANDIDQIIGDAGQQAPNQILIRLEGTNHDAGETISVDFVQIEVNATVTVNSEPYFLVGYPQINSSNGGNTTRKNLTVYFVPVDNENTTLRYNVTWFKDNISQFTLPLGTYETTTNAINSSYLDFRNLSDGDTWKAGVTLFDGGFVNYTNTSEILILRYALRIEHPTTTNTITTNSGKNITIQYNYSISGVNITDGVEILNITIGNLFVNILNNTINVSKKYNFSGSHENHYSYSKGTDNINAPPSFTSARDGTEIDSTCYTNLGQSDNNLCTQAATGTGVEPWIRFNFTIAESVQQINSIRIEMEAQCTGGCPGGEQVEFILLNYTSGTWETWATGTVAEATRELTLENSNAFNAVVGPGGQLVILAEGNALDDGDSIEVDFIQIEINYTSYPKQEWYDGTWKVNVTVPSGLTGFQDLAINATLEGIVRNHTQASAIEVVVAANTAPNNPSSLIINSTNVLHTNRTDEDLRMSFLCDDPDTSDTLTFHLTAFKNNINQFQMQGSCSDPEYKSIVLDYINTTKNYNWSFSVNVSDAAGDYSTTISSIVNISILNTPPIIGNITLDEADPISIIEGGNKTFKFSFVVTDADNQTDIVNNSAVANITRTGEAIRYNDTFVNVNDGGCNAVNLVGNNGKNFSCTINIVFYDGAGLWNIATRINDSVKRIDVIDYAFAQNTTKTFTIAETSSISLDTSTFSFPLITPNQYNTTSLVNITIRNIGNDDISGIESTGETINISAITLVPSTGTTFIPASNFSIGQVNASGTFKGDFCDYSISANVTRLRNVTDSVGYSNFSGAINGSSLLAQATNNVHTVGLCLLHAPSDLQSTTYSTVNSGAWIITVFAVGRRKKKDWITEALENSVNSLLKKNEISKENIKFVIESLVKDYSLDPKDIIKLFTKEIEIKDIPITIFDNKELSSLEIIVKYLKENIGYTYAKIAKLLNRDQRTIWITYKKSIKKKPEIILAKKTDYLIPIEILTDRELGVLESISKYLHEYYNLRFKEISLLLHKDQRTIWTSYNRARHKKFKE